MTQPAIASLLLDQLKRSQASQDRIEHELKEIKDRLVSLFSEDEHEAKRSFIEKHDGLKDIEEKLLFLRDLAVLVPEEFDELVKLAVIKLDQNEKNSKT